MKIHFLLCIIFMTAIATAQVRVITVGTIDKIDEKGKTISLVGATSATIEAPKESPDPSRGSTARGGGGGRGARGGRNGGSTDRPDTGQKNYPTPSGAPTKVPKNIEVTSFKVKVLPATVFKEGDKEIHLSDLKVGDIIQVTSPKPAATLDAVEITRMPKEK
jgi:hypothetical protein